jgi:hypothetical protein
MTAHQAGTAAYADDAAACLERAAFIRGRGNENRKVEEAVALEVLRLW